MKKGANLLDLGRSTAATLTPNTQGFNEQITWGSSWSGCKWCCDEAIAG